jgi:flagellin-like hook-associated protein FlgL
MSDITLSAGIRANLLSLQQTSDLMTLTQNRLATGKKVNSALDNPLNFFQSSALSARANDLSGLLDTMASGISTINAANNGITAITSLVQQLKATVSQARADNTGTPITAGTALTLSSSANNSTALNNKLTFHLANSVDVGINVDPGTTAATLTGSGGAAITAGTAGDITISSAGINGGAAITVTLASGDTLAQVATKINTAITTADATNGGHLRATVDATSGELVLTNDTGNQVTIADAAGNANGTTAQLGFNSGDSSVDGVVGTPLTVDQIVSAINANSNLNTSVKASNVSGRLSLQNLTTTAIAVDGLTAAAVTGDATDTQTLTAGTGGTISSVRQSLKNQFNDLLGQIDKAVTDAGYNGINLLNGDDLKLNFNENGTSSITIQSKDASGNKFVLNSTNLGFSTATDSDFSNNTTLDSLSTTIATALTTLRTQASSLGSSLSVVQTRQDFTKSMVNTLQTGADNLVLADTNEEGANLLALQTRQSLSTTALSLSAQADQNVLRLFQ